MKALGVCSSTNLSKVVLTLSTSASTRREGGKCRAGKASAWRPRVWAGVVSPREGVTPAGFSRLWYLLIKSMTEVKQSSLSSSTEERDSGRSPSWSLGEDGQKRASFSDMEGAGSTVVGGFARETDKPSLTVRESEMSCGRLSSRCCVICWTPPTPPPHPSPRGGVCLVNLHPRTLRKTMRIASLGSGWSCVSCWSCSEPRDSGACLSIGSVEADPKGYPRLPTSRRPRGYGPWWGCPWRASQ